MVDYTSEEITRVDNIRARILSHLPTAMLGNFYILADADHVRLREPKTIIDERVMKVLGYIDIEYPKTEYAETDDSTVDEIAKQSEMLARFKRAYAERRASAGPLCCKPQHPSRARSEAENRLALSGDPPRWRIIAPEHRCRAHGGLH